MTHTTTPEREAEAHQIWARQFEDQRYGCIADAARAAISEALSLRDSAIARAEQAEARIERLVNLRDIQSSQGNFDCDEYMRGMANGLILAVCTMRDDEPKFHEATPSPQAEPVGLSVTPRLGDATYDQLWETSILQRRRVKALERSLGGTLDVLADITHWGLSEKARLPHMFDIERAQAACQKASAALSPIGGKL